MGRLLIDFFKKQSHMIVNAPVGGFYGPRLNVVFTTFNHVSLARTQRL